jgi:pseudouridine-5'-phosphate glycosidase/pseudouridine kinase
VPKAAKIFMNPVVLGLFPNHSINTITPTISELEAMFTAAQINGFFESNEWWTILDSFGVESLFRQGTTSHIAKVAVDIHLKDMPDLIESGIIQQAIKLLPYIPTILIKLGPRGALSVYLSPKTMKTVKGVRSQGANVDICVQHHPGTKVDQIVSVTGAGYIVL